MTGILPSDLRLRVIRPVCLSLDMGGDNVEELVLGTAMQESGCGSRIVQNGGPALGVWQMEEATHDDIWDHFLAYRPLLAAKISTYLFTALPKSLQLIGNLYYACAMARLQYYRSPNPIPVAGDLEGQAALYCAVYNTSLGKATTAEYIANANLILGGAHV